MSVSFGALPGLGFFNSTCTDAPRGATFPAGSAFLSRVVPSERVLEYLDDPDPSESTETDRWLQKHLEVVYHADDGQRVVYRVTRQLGQGYFGTVFRLDADTDVYPRSLAVKWIHKDAYEELQATKVVQEMLAASGAHSDFVSAQSIWGTFGEVRSAESREDAARRLWGGDWRRLLPQLCRCQALVAMQCADGDLETYWERVVREAPSKEELETGALRVLGATARCLLELYKATGCVYSDTKTANFLVSCVDGHLNVMLADYGGLAIESNDVGNPTSYPVPTSIRKRDDEVDEHGTPYFEGVANTQSNAVYGMFPMLLELLDKSTDDLGWWSTQKRAFATIRQVLGWYKGTPVGRVFEWLVGTQLTFAELVTQIESELTGA